MNKINELTAKLKAVARHSVDGYDKDPEGEFVFYDDYEALVEALEAANTRIAELEARTIAVKLPPVEIGRVNGVLINLWSAYDVLRAIESAGLKLQIEGE